MNYRKLRNTWSVVFGVAFLLLIAWWVRSYRWVDWWQGPVGGNFSLHGQSDSGAITVIQLRKSIQPASGTCSIAGVTFPPNPGYATMVSGNPSAIYRTLLPEKDVVSVLPHWLLSFISATIAAAPWLPWHKSRYSLRTLLIGMTLVAIGLGLAVYTLRQ